MAFSLMVQIHISLLSPNLSFYFTLLPQKYNKVKDSNKLQVEIMCVLTRPQIYNILQYF